LGLPRASKRGRASTKQTNRKVPQSWLRWVTREVTQCIGAREGVSPVTSRPHLGSFIRCSVFNQPATLDARLIDSSWGNPVASSRNLAIANTKLPPRPDFGTAGTAVKLRTNFFPLRVPRGPLYEYNVVINPSTRAFPRRVKKRIFQLAEVTQGWTSLLKGRVAHDHDSKLVSAQKLPQPLVLEVPLFGGREERRAGGEVYTLTINYVRDLDMQSLTECIHFRCIRPDTELIS
jgi:hypothetical protein